MRSSASTPSARRHLRGRGFGAAGVVGPCHEMIAAEARLAHHVLEGDVGGARHRDVAARGRWRCRDCARRPAAPRDWRAPSSRSGRGRRARRSAPAHWPRTGIAAAAGCTARGWSAPSGRPASPARRQTVCAPLPQACIGMRNADFADRRIQRFVIERDPMAERREHPLRHVGGGGLGEGDAEDLFRRHAARATAGSRAAPAHGSCPSRHWPTRTRTPPDRTRAPASRGRRAEWGAGAFTIPRSPGRRPRTIP